MALNMSELNPAPEALVAGSAPATTLPPESPDLSAPATLEPLGSTWFASSGIGGRHHRPPPPTIESSSDADVLVVTETATTTEGKRTENDRADMHTSEMPQRVVDGGKGEREHASPSVTVVVAVKEMPNEGTTAMTSEARGKDQVEQTNRGRCSENCSDRGEPEPGASARYRRPRIEGLANTSWATSPLPPDATTSGVVGGVDVIRASAAPPTAGSVVTAACTCISPASSINGCNVFESNITDASAAGDSDNNSFIDVGGGGGSGEVLGISSVVMLGAIADASDSSAGDGSEIPSAPDPSRKSEPPKSAPRAMKGNFNSGEERRGDEDEERDGSRARPRVVTSEGDSPATDDEASGGHRGSPSVPVPETSGGDAGGGPSPGGAGVGGGDSSVGERAGDGGPSLAPEPRAGGKRRGRKLSSGGGTLRRAVRSGGGGSLNGLGCAGPEPTSPAATLPRFASSAEAAAAEAADVIAPPTAVPGMGRPLGETRPARSTTDLGMQPPTLLRQSSRFLNENLADARRRQNQRGRAQRLRRLSFADEHGDALFDTTYHAYLYYSSEGVSKPRRGACCTVS